MCCWSPVWRINACLPLFWEWDWEGRLGMSAYSYPPGSGHSSPALDLVFHTRDSLVSLIQRIYFWCSAGEGERQLLSCVRKASDLRDLPTTSYNPSFLSSPHHHPPPGYPVSGPQAEVSGETRFILSGHRCWLRVKPFQACKSISTQPPRYSLQKYCCHCHLQLVVLCLKISLFGVVSVGFWKKQY